MIGAATIRASARRRRGRGQWYRLITNAFLHEPGLSGFGPAHIIFNMWALIVVGPALEQMLGPGCGSWPSTWLSALGGSVVFYLVASPGATALGASGRHLRPVRGVVRGGQAAAAGQPGRSSCLIVLNLAISFVVPHIAWQDHVGGLVAGAALTAAYVYAPRDRRTRTLIQVGATAAAGADPGRRRGDA